MVGGLSVGRLHMYGEKAEKAIEVEVEVEVGKSEASQLNSYGLA